MRPHPTVLAAAACVALAAWASLGELAVTATTSATPRLGVLPPVWLLPVFVAVGLAALRRLPPKDTLPLFLTALLLLPWLPSPLPAAATIWTGPLASWVWVVAALGLVSAARPQLPSGPLGDPRKAPLLAGLLGLALCAAGARAIAGVAPTGDEPHYLILTQSLLEDGDLRVENNHAQRDYEEYYPSDLRPHSQRRGRDGEIYSIHAPGLPALLVPAFAAGGRDGAVLFIAALSALGGAFFWRIAHRLTGDAGAAWFGWACAALTAPPFFQAITVFPDAPGAVLVLTGLAFLVRDELGSQGDAGPRTLALHGLALAALPWLHSRFAPLAGVLGACIVLRLLRSVGAPRRIAAFLALPVASAALWLGFFQWIYGTPSPSAPYSMDTFNLANALRGFPGLFFDRRCGLLSHAPVMAFALVGLHTLARERRRLAIELLLVAGIYLAVVSGFGIWWGGASAPARLTAPVLPCLALAAAALWARATRASTRAGGALLLSVSLLVTAMLACSSDGELLQSDRAGRAGWLAFVSGTADLSLAVPSFVVEPTATAAGRAAAWVVLSGLAAWAVHRWARRGPSPGALALATAGSLSMTVMAAATLGAGGRLPLAPTRAGLRLLQAFDPNARPLGLALFPLGRLTPAALLAGIRLGGDEPEGRELALHGVPAGDYRLSLEDPPESGRLRVQVGASRRPLAERPLDERRASTFRLAVDVAHLAIAMEDSQGRVVGRPTLEPVEIVPTSARLTRRPALAAAGYGAADVFALDGGVSLEADGFWVAGGRTNEVVIQPRDPAGSVGLQVRNAPVANEISLELGPWRWARTLSPGAEAFVPLPPTTGVLRIGTSSGFHPQGAGDGARPRGRRGGRFLGAWMRVEAGSP